MLFELRLLFYRFLKIFMKPVSRLVAVPRPVLFVGPDSARRLCQLIANSGCRRVLIATDSVLAQLGIVDPVRQSLAEQGVDVAVFDGIIPDPTDDVLYRGAAAVRAHGSDAILAIGGGSSIDGAKVIAAMATTGKSPRKLVGMLKVSKAPLSLYAIPTTAGTGSEVTVAAVVTDPVKHEKAAVIDPKLVPLAAALDPVMMKGMPRPITAATGMDALTHAVEAYINRWPHPETPALCVSAVRLIFQNLPRAYENGDDLEAREATALASLYAGLAFTKAYVGYVHAFSHKLGGTYGVPHGLCNAVVLPYVLDFVKDNAYARKRLAELAVAIGAGKESESADALAQRFVDRVRALNRDLGVPETIAELKEQDLQEVARAAMIEASRDYPVPKNMSLSEAVSLLNRLLPARSAVVGT
jgi:alcohol dehydrogenase class IV